MNTRTFINQLFLILFIPMLNAYACSNRHNNRLTPKNISWLIKTEATTLPKAKPRQPKNNLADTAKQSINVSTGNGSNANSSDYNGSSYTKGYNITEIFSNYNQLKKSENSVKEAIQEPKKGIKAAIQEPKKGIKEAIQEPKKGIKATIQDFVGKITNKLPLTKKKEKEQSPKKPSTDENSEAQNKKGGKRNNKIPNTFQHIKAVAQDQLSRWMKKIGLGKKSQQQPEQSATKTNTKQKEGQTEQTPSRAATTLPSKWKTLFSFANC